MGIMNNENVKKSNDLKLLKSIKKIATNKTRSRTRNSKIRRNTKTISVEVSLIDIICITILFFVIVTIGIAICRKVICTCIGFRDLKKYDVVEPQIVDDALTNINIEKNKYNNSNQMFYQLLSTLDDNKVEKKEELSTETIDLEYITKYEVNPELPQGIMQVSEEGRTGSQLITTKKIYENGKLISEEQVGKKVLKSPSNKVIQIGGADYKVTYKIKKKDVVYVTANLLTLRKEPNSNSEKIIKLKKDEEATVLDLSGDWCEIQYNNYTGWVEKNCLTKLDPEEEVNNNGYTKTRLLAYLNKNMDLRKPSGFTLEQFKKVLSDNPQDKNNIFKDNAGYFYYLEKQYNINGIFVAAIAIHESNWGTSEIARDKNNLFGYRAYDSVSYNSAESFANYSEGIDLIARVLVKYYLNPAGTEIYNGEKALGKYYSSPTLSGVNKKYATDSNWANGVYKWMDYLYNRL